MPFSLFYHFSRCFLTNRDGSLCPGRLERQAGQGGDHAHLISGVVARMGQRSPWQQCPGTCPSPSVEGVGVPSVIRTRLVGQPEGHPGEGTALCVSSSSIFPVMSRHRPVTCSCWWVCFKGTEQGSGLLRPGASGRLGHLEFPCLRTGGDSSRGQWRGQMLRRRSVEFLASPTLPRHLPATGPTAGQHPLDSLPPTLSGSAGSQLALVAFGFCFFIAG